MVKKVLECGLGSWDDKIRRANIREQIVGKIEGPYVGRGGVFGGRTQAKATHRNRNRSLYARGFIEWTAYGFLEGEKDSFVKFRKYGWVLGAVNRAEKVGDLRETETRT